VCEVARQRVRRAAEDDVTESVLIKLTPMATAVSHPASKNPKSIEAIGAAPAPYLGGPHFARKHQPYLLAKTRGEQ
jgi:hypothetical protein